MDAARAALAAARAAARSAAGAGACGGDGVASRSTSTGRARRAAATRRSGARPDERDPQPLGASIERLLSDRGWERPAAVGGVMGDWERIVGPQVAAHCQPESFDDGLLTLRADSTAWATQVRLLAPTLTRTLNTALGHGAVTRIKVLGPAAPPRVGGRLRAPGSRGARDTYG